MKTLLSTTFTLWAFVLFGQMDLKRPVKSIPRLSIYNLHGDTTDLKKLSHNKVTLIDFWFIPCGPCFLEMNMLHTLYARYKDNPDVSFLTITITDSSFIRPLSENKNTETNDSFDYFKTLARLDTFRLPVYFIKDASSKMLSFKKTKKYFSGHAEPQPEKTDYSKYPDNIFGFSGYPTLFIFDKKGNTIYSKTGFTKSSERQQQKIIEILINSKI